MKTQNFILMLLLSSAAAIAQTNGTDANTKKLSKNYFYVSPFNFAASQFLVAYERDINERNGLSFLHGIILNQSFNDDNFVDFGYSGELQYRYHMIVIARPKEGDKTKFRFDFYMAPFAQYQYLETEYDNYQYDNNTGYGSTYTYKEHVNAVSGGILFGGKCTFFERFSIDTYMGGGIKYSDREIDNYNHGPGIFLAGYTGIIGKANLQMGVAF